MEAISRTRLEEIQGELRGLMEEIEAIKDQEDAILESMPENLQESKHGQPSHR